MDYEKLCSIILDDVFSNSSVNLLVEYPECRRPVFAHLSQYEWERIRWGFWAPAFVACLNAWADMNHLFNLDVTRMNTLLNQGYPSRFRDDGVRMVVGDYLRNRADIRALKSSGLVPCSLFSRIEDQTTTRGTLTRALALHRITTLLEAYVEGCRFSRFVEQERHHSGELTGFFAEFTSGISNKTKDGLSRTAMVFAEMVLDSCDFRRDQKSLDVVEMLFGLFEETYKECRNHLGEHLNSET